MRQLQRSRERSLPLRDRYNKDSQEAKAKQNAAAQPRLRRIKAYSKLALKGAQPDTANTSLPMLAYQEHFEDTIAQGRTSVDEEDASVIPHELFAQPSLECLSEVSTCSSMYVIGVLLQRKNRSEDLRARFAVGAMQNKAMARAQDSPDMDSGSLDKTIDSEDTLVNQHQENVHCVCRQSVEESSRDMVMCEVCCEWFHLDCVGQGQKHIDFFEDHEFFCPACEAIAFKEIAAEEEATTA